MKLIRNFIEICGLYEIETKLHRNLRPYFEVSTKEICREVKRNSALPQIGLLTLVGSTDR